MIETTSKSNIDRKARLLCNRWARVVGLTVVVTAVFTTRVEAQFLSASDMLPPLTNPAGLPIPGAVAVAQAARTQILPQLIQNDDQFAKRLGFDSASQVAPHAFPFLTVGQPFAVFCVGLDQLQQFQQGQDPLILLGDLTNWVNTVPPMTLMFSGVRFLFPIKVGVDVKSSVFVSFSLSSNHWEVQQLGSPHLIAALTSQGSGTTHFVVWIPALNRYYLGRIDQGVFKIKVMFNDPTLNLNSGAEREAKQVFWELKNKEASGTNLNDPQYPPR